MSNSWERVPEQKHSTNVEKFKEGQFSPTPEELEAARRKGGGAAVEELRKKMSHATGKIREKQSDKATEELEKDFKRKFPEKK